MDNSKVSFYDLFSKGTYEGLCCLADGNLQSEDGWSFEIHRVILAKSNLYFRVLFCGTDGGRKCGLIPGIKGETLDQILCYIYTGIISLNNENISQLMTAAYYLLVDSLMDQVKKFVKDNISADSCFPIYVSASKIQQKEICQLSYRFIQTHFEMVVLQHSSEFGEISLRCLKKFLQDNNLCVRSERQVWFSVVKWVHKDPPSRLFVVPELLNYLKIADIDESLAYEIIHDDIVYKNPFCTELLTTALQSELPNSLDILRHFVEDATGTSVFPDLNFYSHRIPKLLYLIYDYKANFINIYITYDENIDIWRQFIWINYSEANFLVIGRNVYKFGTSRNINSVFNLVEKKWSNMPGFYVPRTSYKVVKLKGNIYALGGQVDSVRVNNVDCYNPESVSWFAVSPMMSVDTFEAVSCQDRIFVVGEILHETKFLMIAQLYDDEFNEWSLIAPPNIFRRQFSLVEFHGKVYIIGGIGLSVEVPEVIKEVEVYDFEKGTWGIITYVPSSYAFPVANVFNNQLILFDVSKDHDSNDENTKPLRWNETDKLWEPVDRSLTNLVQYNFITIDDTDTVYILTKENRDPSIQFERSPFN